MKPVATRIAEALGQTAVAPLIQRARELEAITAALREAASDIATDSISRCEFRGETLSIVADNPAKAAKLRQKIPQFQRLLAENDAKVTSIRVIHQPGLTNYPVQAIQSACTAGTAQGRPVDTDGPTRFAAEIAQSSPSSRLGRAAERLLRTLTRR